MSHVHNINGYNDAASEYQQYLERLKSVTQSERDQEAIRRRRAKSFDTAIDTEEDLDSEAESQGESETPAEPELREESNPQADSDLQKESEADGTFGRHYA